MTGDTHLLHVEQYGGTKIANATHFWEIQVQQGARTVEEGVSSYANRGRFIDSWMAEA
jgi:hypothetical protein